MSLDELRLRCRSFVLRTQGDWDRAALERFEKMLHKRGISGPVHHHLEAAREERREDAVYVCVGASCAKQPLSVPNASVREAACLGNCRHAPSAHRVRDGVGQTYSMMGDALLAALCQGASSEALQVRRWEPGALFPSPGLAPLRPLRGAWSGPGGFSTPDGCTRTLQVRYSLGGQFLDLEFCNAWPTIPGGVDRFPERLTLQADGDSFVGVLLNHRGAQHTIAAVCSEQTITVMLNDSTRRRLSLVDGVLIEQHERLRDGDWRVGFRARMRPDRSEGGV